MDRRAGISTLPRTRTHTHTHAHTLHTAFCHTAAPPSLPHATRRPARPPSTHLPLTDSGVAHATACTPPTSLRPPPHAPPTLRPHPARPSSPPHHTSYPPTHPRTLPPPPPPPPHTQHRLLRAAATYHYLATCLSACSHCRCLFCFAASPSGRGGAPAARRTPQQAWRQARGRLDVSGAWADRDSRVPANRLPDRSNEGRRNKRKGGRYAH